MPQDRLSLRASAAEVSFTQLAATSYSQPVYHGDTMLDYYRDDGAPLRRFSCAFTRFQRSPAAR